MLRILAAALFATVLIAAPAAAQPTGGGTTPTPAPAPAAKMAPKEKPMAAKPMMH